MKFSVPDMSCGHCTATIEKAVKAAAPEAEVACDLDTRTVDITGVESPETPLTAMLGAGYEAELLKPR